MKYKNLSYSKFFLYLKKLSTEKDLLEIAGVHPDTYASSFVKELYQAIFVNSRNLNNEYQKYYACEYDTVEDFLFWRYGVEKEFFEGISKDKTASGVFLLVNNDKITVGENDEMNASVRDLLSKLDGDT